MSGCTTPELTVVAVRSHSPSPPIFKLTDDALSAILQLIVADTPATFHIGPRRALWIKEDKSRPLATLLCCSQVCKKWRSLIATSPLLWASAVDLDALSLRPREWVDNFIGLTRQAPLRVYSLYSRPHIHAQSPQFVLSFLNEHWPRIREVKATLIGNYSQLFETIYSDLPEHRKIFLTQPAPLLETFKVHFALTQFHPDFAVPNSDSFPFFNGEAPALRKFECHDLPGFLPLLSSTELRHLRISFEAAYHAWKRSHRLPISRSNVLTTLAGASSLESLVIAGNFYDSKMGALKNIPEIHLPRLKYLSITEETFLTAIDILDRIKPAAGCGLHLDVHSESTTVAHPHFASLEAYATSFFNTHSISHLELVLMRFAVYFSAKCCCVEHKDKPAQFYIKNAAGLTFETLASLSACNYSRVTHLSVQASFSSTLDSSAHAFTATNIHIEKFFALLSSVATIETSIYFLNEFLTRQPNATILLPNLQHVQLATSAAGYEMDRYTQGWISHDDPHQFKGPLCQFAAHRRDIGVPLSTVDKSRYWISLADQIVPPPIDIHNLLAQTLHKD
ncbi:hypothetical protein D9619_006857 [Psilocybe cf. subviscida]|uniref:F-box domain-containing protein n=1 Tax=Psilocybe cf. subviscida TaxID=2480587 RepID=A0A8H5B4F7_9AGAR|nr:hypothetical protein D9619_006857 [Psilocybe cf. subviscida]